MEVIIKVPKKVYKKLILKGEVFPEVWEEPTDKCSYKNGYVFLSEVSKFSSFFFAMKYDQNWSTDKILEIQNICSMSSEENTDYLLLDVPEKILFKHEYYDFTDYLYYEFNAGTSEERPDYVRELKDRISNQVVNTDVIQVLLPVLKKEWII